MVAVVPWGRGDGCEWQGQEDDGRHDEPCRLLSHSAPLVEKIRMTRRRDDLNGDETNSGMTNVLSWNETI